jgi:hypothetical protein
MEVVKFGGPLVKGRPADVGPAGLCGVGYFTRLVLLDGVVPRVRFGRRLRDSEISVSFSSVADSSSNVSVSKASA